MKFAIPVSMNKFANHFGHCEKFAIIHTVNKQIVNNELVTPPVHQPGIYPKFIAGLGVKVVLVGGIGQKAQNLFKSNNIEVCKGVQPASPTDLVEDYLNNRLQTGSNLCDH